MARAQSKTADGSPRRPFHTEDRETRYDARLASSLFIPSAASVATAPDSR